MKYLLDTCTVSDFVKGHPQILARIKATAPELICVSAVTRMEIEYGLALNAGRRISLGPVMQALFSAIATLPFDVADALAAASVRAALKIKGRPIGAYDVLIAGTALARGLAVVTSNAREFERIGGLSVEDWR